jgi:hypothetical protein
MFMYYFLNFITTDSLIDNIMQRNRIIFSEDKILHNKRAFRL